MTAASRHDRNPLAIFQNPLVAHSFAELARVIMWLGKLASQLKSERLAGDAEIVTNAIRALHFEAQR